MSTVVIPGDLNTDDFSIGGVVPNSITVQVDGTTVSRGTGGLSSPNQTLSYNNTTNELVLTNNGDVDTVLDLSALTTDIYVDGASFDANTAVLTLTDNDTGTGDVTVNLAALLGVSVDANNVLTDGSDGKPFLDPTEFNVSGDANNVLVNGSDNKPYFDSSTLTACTNTFGNVNLFRAFPA